MPKKNCDSFAMKKKTHGRRRRSALSLTAGRSRRRIDTTSDRLATKFRVVENFHPVLSLLGFLATTTG
jgi:acid phosphatase class B